MTKHPDDHEDHEDQEPDGQGRRRIRLRPRSGAEHRFGFARRWEARRRSRSSRSIWALVGLDIGALLLIYLVAREVVRRLGGD